jgi:RimJ/RimL family protein N-acetyltransferase
MRGENDKRSAVIPLFVFSKTFKSLHLNMLKLDFSIFPTLYTERLILKEMTDLDAGILFELRSDPEIMKYIDRPKPNSISDIHELIEKMRQMKIKGEGISWGIYLKENPNLYVMFLNEHEVETEETVILIEKWVISKGVDPKQIYVVNNNYNLK